MSDQLKNRLVPGSSPGGPTNKINDLSALQCCGKAQSDLFPTFFDVLAARPFLARRGGFPDLAAVRHQRQ